MAPGYRPPKGTPLCPVSGDLPPVRPGCAHWSNQSFPGLAVSASLSAHQLPHSNAPKGMNHLCTSKCHSTPAWHVHLAHQVCTPGTRAQLPCSVHVQAGILRKVLCSPLCQSRQNPFRGSHWRVSAGMQGATGPIFLRHSCPFSQSLSLGLVELLASSTETVVAWNSLKHLSPCNSQVFSHRGGAQVFSHRGMFHHRVGRGWSRGGSSTPRLHTPWPSRGGCSQYLPWHPLSSARPGTRGLPEEHEWRQPQRFCTAATQQHPRLKHRTRPFDAGQTQPTEDSFALDQLATMAHENWPLANNKQAKRKEFCCNQ